MKRANILINKNKSYYLSIGNKGVVTKTLNTIPSFGVLF